MTEEELIRLRTILKEHLQSFCLVGFDLQGKLVRSCDYETQIQGMAIAEAIRSEVNQNTQAQEVWVRNAETEG